MLKAWAGGVRHCVRPVGVYHQPTAKRSWLLMGWVPAHNTHMHAQMRGRRNVAIFCAPFP